MTRIEALRALYAAVKDGAVGHDGFCDMWHSEGLCVHAEGANAGSVDAALALMQSVLPGYVWGRHWSGHMWVERYDLPGRSDRFQHDHPTPARALLLAIIAALIAQEASE